MKENSLIAMEDLNNEGLARGFLAKEVLDCSWAEFATMISYKAEEAGCEVVLVNPAHTSQMCSTCGLVRKKSLAERWHDCPCGASMHRDLNAAMNILNRATGGTPGSNASGDGAIVPSLKEEVQGFSLGKFGWTTPEGVLVSLIILMCGHFILLTIELLIALVHTLRLHILEFGTKFMATGTEWFSPCELPRG